MKGRKGAAPSDDSQVALSSDVDIISMELLTSLSESAIRALITLCVSKTIGGKR